ncbi:uncharacterized protein LOC108909084 [Anoplophora glabripennis]|uniref:uncharacterized protein LOC108909084 n=1 Tax=Anoplophora glabripennis TaxID=217634 RepID=UPI0008737229|nr:uncharacterized protein LOC108909084 [Anoplophora glabripennis]
MKFLILLFVTFAVAAEDELSKCKCQKGYYPQKDESGVVSCYGSILKTNEKSILPCNVLVKPSCICKDDATSIVQDESGTWCSKVSEGKEDKRWPCENKEDWAAFYSAHPEEKP